MQMYQFNKKDGSGKLDTTKESDLKEVLVEIGSMTGQELTAFAEQVVNDPATNVRVSILREVVRRETQSALSVAVYDASRQKDPITGQPAKGVWAVGAAMLDGYPEFMSAPQRHGQDSAQDSAFSHYRDQSTELRVSSKDAEVNTLEQLWNYFRSISDFNPYHEIRVIISGNLGPCDGCKQRIRQFALSVQQLINDEKPNHAIRLIIETNYYTATSSTNKRGPTTQYGYTDDSKMTIPTANRLWPGFSHEEVYVIPAFRPMAAAASTSAAATAASASASASTSASASSSSSSSSGSSSSSSSGQQTHTKVDMGDKGVNK